LILTKIRKENGDTRCQTLKSKCTKFDFRSAPDRAGGADSAPRIPWLYLRGLLLREGEEEGGRKKGREWEIKGRERRGRGEGW